MNNKVIVIVTDDEDDENTTVYSVDSQGVVVIDDSETEDSKDCDKILTNLPPVSNAGVNNNTRARRSTEENSLKRDVNTVIIGNETLSRSRLKADNANHTTKQVYDTEISTQSHDKSKNNNSILPESEQPWTSHLQKTSSDPSPDKVHTPCSRRNHSDPPICNKIWKRSPEGGQNWLPALENKGAMTHPRSTANKPHFSFRGDEDCALNSRARANSTPLSSKSKRKCTTKDQNSFKGHTSHSRSRSKSDPSSHKRNWKFSPERNQNSLLMLKIDCKSAADSSCLPHNSKHPRTSHSRSRNNSEPPTCKGKRKRSPERNENSPPSPKCRNSKFESNIRNSCTTTQENSNALQISHKKPRTQSAPSASNLLTSNTNSSENLTNFEHLSKFSHILFVDLDNWARFYKLPYPLSQSVFVWGFCGGNFVFTNKASVHFRSLVQEHRFYQHPKCGRSKDAADFALCVQAARMDLLLPAHIPFTVLSGDNGFGELANQLKSSARQIHLINPHEQEQDILYATLKSIGEM